MSTTCTAVTLIEGTWGGAWAQPGSDFRLFLQRDGGCVVGDSFEWSNDLSGVPSVTGSRRHSDWRAGAAAFGYFLRGMPYAERNVIAHSHGGQVSLYAAGAYNVWIRRLITVATPVRKDMLAVAALARQNIGYWAHVASKDGDWAQRFGELFDGQIGWTRTQPSADVNILIPKIGHVGILADPQYIPRWRSEALLDVLQAADEQVGARNVAK